MTKQIINLGTPDKGDGDPLRTAFSKVNENFTELYNSLGLELDNNLNLGAFEFTGSIITTTDSTSIVIDQATTVSSDLTVGGNIVPQTANGGDLGSLNKPWRSLYVSNRTVYLGGVPLSVEAETNTLKINNIPISQTIAFTDIPDAPAVPVDISDLTDDEGLLSGGVGSITVGNGTDTSVENVTEILINGTITEIEPGLVGVTISGGTTQPYLELTDTPIVIQPVVLGDPVTVTVPPSGFNAELIVEIGEGPVINAIVIVSPGTDYVVGQRYRIWNYQIGGGGDSNSIDFEVATVGQAGELLTITGAAFTGPTPNNPQQTYTNISPDYQPQTVLDEIDVGLTLTRDQNQGIYNIELEQDYDRDNYLSPLGTEWNSDGWGDLLGLESRTYTTWRQALNNQVGNNIVASELVMHDIANDKYYKFDFTNWGGSNGNYSYTRTLISEDRNYFRKDDYATANNVDVIEDDSTLQIGITRGNNNGIYNPFTEEDWDQNVSPQGTLWNIDGWDDLSDVETRTYTNFYAAYGNGQLGNRVPGSRAVMYVPSIEKYYAIEWLGWTQNNVGGGFSYNRYEIDLTKLNEGITFADGTVQKTAYVDTNVVSTAQGERRIETASGYKQVAVTERVTNDYTGAVNATTNGYELRIARTPELDAVLLPLRESDLDAAYTLSFDNTTYREIWFSSVQETEYWFYYENDFGQTTPQTEGDPVYLRIITGGDSQIWWNKSELPGGASDFRGAVIDYHAFTGEATIIGTIHIVDDDGENYITHTEVSSGDNDSMNDNLWIVTSEGTIRYARFDGEAKTLKIHWTGKVFYGSEYNDD